MIPSEVKGGTTPTTTAGEIDRLRLKYRFWMIITGFALVAFITILKLRLEAAHSAVEAAAVEIRRRAWLNEGR